MPEENDPGPAQGRPAADIPDLKKLAAERGPSGFAWSADSTLPKGQTAVPSKGPALLSNLLSKVKSAGAKKAGALVLLLGVGLGVGLGVFGVAFLEVEERKPDAPKGFRGLFTSLKVRPGGRDRMRYLVNKGGIFLDFIKGKKGKPGTETVVDSAEGAALPGVVEGEEGAAGQGSPEQPAPPPATNSGSFMGGATAAAASSSGPNGQAQAPGEFSFPKLNPANGKGDGKRSRELRRSRGTLGVTDTRKELRSSRDLAGRSVGAKTSARSGGDAQAQGTPVPSGLDLVRGGKETGAAGPASAGGQGGPEGDGGGSSGGGPGAGGPAPDDAEDPNSVLNTMRALLDKSAAEAKKAKEEKQKALALAAAGLHPGAAYHYARGEKAEKKSKEYAAKARAMADKISAETQAPAQQEP